MLASSGLKLHRTRRKNDVSCKIRVTVRGMVPACSRHLPAGAGRAGQVTKQGCYLKQGRIKTGKAGRQVRQQ
eukprot:5192570-Amphidinium_carterae.1